MRAVACAGGCEAALAPQVRASCAAPAATTTDTHKRARNARGCTAFERSNVLPLSRKGAVRWRATAHTAAQWVHAGTDRSAPA